MSRVSHALPFNFFIISILICMISIIIAIPTSKKKEMITFPSSHNKKEEEEVLPFSKVYFTRKEKEESVKHYENLAKYHRSKGVESIKDKTILINPNQALFHLEEGQKYDYNILRAKKTPVWREDY